MNQKKIFSIFLLLAGETLLIISFLHFGRNLDSKLLTLNIAVSTIIFSFFFIGILVPRVDLKDKSHKSVGAIGMRELFTTIYIIAAIVAMVFFTLIQPIDFYGQILIQAILLFGLSLGLYFALSSSDKVQQVYDKEIQSRGRLEDMKKATKEIQQKLNQMDNISGEIISRMNALQENLRFVSPSNNPESILLQSNFLNKTKCIKDCLFDIPLNNEKIIENIKSCEIIYNEIKHNFSN